MVSSQPRLDVGKLKDETVAEEFENWLGGDLGVQGALRNPESCGVPLRPPSLMLPVVVLEPTVKRSFTDADESFGRGCLQPMFVSAKRSVH